MSLIPLALVKDHLNVIHNEDDGPISTYLEAAERSAAQFLNRALYDDDAALDYARGLALTTLSTALATYETDYDTASAIENLTARCESQAQVDLTRDRAIYAYRATMDGMVPVEDVKTAILLTVGALYMDRAEANTMPPGAMRMLWPYRVGLGV